MHHIADLKAIRKKELRAKVVRKSVKVKRRYTVMYRLANSLARAETSRF